MDEPPSIAEELLTAFMVRLYRKGVIDADDIEAIADEFTTEGGARNEELAHLARCIMLDGEGPSDADWRAEQARARFRIVKPDPT